MTSPYRIRKAISGADRDALIAFTLQRLFIAPEHRGGGLLDLLLNHLGVEAATSGALDVRLHVHGSNERAGRDYQLTVAPYPMMRRELPSDVPR